MAPISATDPWKVASPRGALLLDKVTTDLMGAEFILMKEQNGPTPHSSFLSSPGLSPLAHVPTWHVHHAWGDTVTEAFAEPAPCCSDLQTSEPWAKWTWFLFKLPSQVYCHSNGKWANTEVHVYPHGFGDFPIILCYCAYLTSLSWKIHSQSLHLFVSAECCPEQWIVCLHILAFSYGHLNRNALSRFWMERPGSAWIAACRWSVFFCSFVPLLILFVLPTAA